jgi:hypothetical protein
VDREKEGGRVAEKLLKAGVAVMPGVVDLICGEDSGGVGGSNAIVWASSVAPFFVPG